MPPSKIETLPTELLAEIVLYLVLPDIINFTLTSKTICRIVHSPPTWLLKIHHDFGHSESAELSLESPAKDWALQYERLLQPLYTSIAEWQFAWIDNRYWRVTDTPQSPFGKTLNLDNRIVWWVSGQKTFPVPPGQYKVTWGLQVSPRGMAQSPNLLSVGIRQVKFRVKCLDSQEFVSSQVEGSLSDINGSEIRDWTEVSFKGVLDVPFANVTTKELSNVQFEVRGIARGYNQDWT
ncbi:hypothetical protein NEOLI_002783 [Neolecta irregularis DAH-3]|uniref:F-box domain-containing protein n=1 Tax=Neolecta irregularis (strain DAH-3) TaxID=1198029 RepID=A0A1U7LNX9_NEOID|nr:hypothetical protein NEOLI_002783 [Neolecta irregularis DAH-3]|eukprot:OLL24357.1 hypothetical protein NEOLI_002783 [Neolecta irregularis DAH-3]